MRRYWSEEVKQAVEDARPECLAEMTKTGEIAESTFKRLGISVAVLRNGDCLQPAFYLLKLLRHETIVEPPSCVSFAPNTKANISASSFGTSLFFLESFFDGAKGFP